MCALPLDSQALLSVDRLLYRLESQAYNPLISIKTSSTSALSITLLALGALLLRSSRFMALVSNAFPFTLYSSSTPPLP